MKRMRIALIAHDVKKDDLVAFVARHGEFLCDCDLVATRTTGGRLNKAFEFSVAKVSSGPLGGDLQIAAQLADGMISAVFFLRDPLTPMAHEVDIMALLRLCDVYNIPCATNLASAELVISGLEAGRVRRGRSAGPQHLHVRLRSNAGEIREHDVSGKDAACVLDVLDQGM
jgi:methylglyoxal synthase